MRSYVEKLSIVFSYFLKIFSVIDYAALARGSRNLLFRGSSTIDYFAARKVARPPTYVTIEPTNVCNLKCVMCPSPNQTRKKGFLSADNFEKIVDSLDPHVENLSLSLMGEGLLNKQLPQMIRYAKKKGIGVSLSTNLSFLTSEKAEEICSSGLDILTLSIDSEDPVAYERIRKGNSYAEVADKVQNFLKVNRNRVFTVIQKIHFSENASSTWSYISEMNKLGANLVRLKPYRDLDKGKPYLRINNPGKEEKASPRCPYLWKIGVYTWQGDLIPCAVDFDGTTKVGNALQSGQAALWNSATLVQMRDAHIRGKKENLDLCKGCTAIEFSAVSMVLSSFIDATNQIKVLSVVQTLKILLKEMLALPVRRGSADDMNCGPHPPGLGS